MMYQAMHYQIYIKVNGHFVMKSVFVTVPKLFTYPFSFALVALNDFLQKVIYD